LIIRSLTCWCRSQVDTTSVQALIDTRLQIERWTNHSVEFHFATILSPWIRRSLVAGGFGYDHRSRSLPTRPHDVAAVKTPYDISQTGPSTTPTDIESGEMKGTEIADSSFGTIHGNEASVVQVDTPYFHLDLTEAVAAAEASLSELSPQSSRVSKGEDKFELGQSVYESRTIEI
jgi:solute carrier family 26 (sodium-independent sulfate anion transporter), member 11